MAKTTSHELDASGRWVVFRTGSKIQLLDVVRHKTRTAVTAPACGASISGRPLAWVEVSGRGSRIRALTQSDKPEPLRAAAASLGRTWCDD